MTDLHPTLEKLRALIADAALPPCGSCSLCCKLVPVAADELTKPAGVWCPHCTKPGCGIYATRPMPCVVWSCAWLLDVNLHDTKELEPRKCHVVIDPVCDEVVLKHHDGSAPEVLTVVQFWCDPAYPSAWRAPAVRAAMDYYARKMGMCSLVRMNNVTGFLVRPPALSPSGTWEESHHSAPIERDVMMAKIAEVEHG
jgi:hypothetical protein